MNYLTLLVIYLLIGLTFAVVAPMLFVAMWPDRSPRDDDMFIAALVILWPLLAAASIAIGLIRLIGWLSRSIPVWLTLVVLWIREEAGVFKPEEEETPDE